MQSQQKKVKWSRGETADAIEERTDTGITEVSVSKMSNIITDIYGNVSRRPALKLMPFGNPLKNSNLDQTAGGVFASGAGKIQTIPFFITEDDLFVIIFPNTAYRITNNKLVNTIIIKDTVGDPWSPSDSIENVSYAQQNNYLIIANKYWIYKLSLKANNGDYEIIAEPFRYDGAWYTPAGTKSYSVSSNKIPNLAWSGNYSNYVWQNNFAETSTVLSCTSTGVTASQSLKNFVKYLSTGSIVKAPNVGSYFRIEQYTCYYNNSHHLIAFPNDIFDEVYNMNDTVVNGGRCIKIENVQETVNPYKSSITVGIYQGRQLEKTVTFTNFNFINGSTAITVFTTKTGGSSKIYTYEYDMNANAFQWNAENSGAVIYAIGALLTPAADSSATDTALSVESGFIETNPDYLSTNSKFPHFSIVQFKDQRLWTSGYYTYTEDGLGIQNISGLAVASQIAKYNDFKNDYNYENEAITVDILTKHREEVIYLIDYNGLKIFTDNAEYNYDQANGVVKPRTVFPRKRAAFR